MTDDKEARWAEIKIRQPANDLFQYGPSVRVGIAAYPYVDDGIKPFVAQIDTGSGGTAISARVVSELGLKPTGSKGEISEAGREPIFASYYSIGIFLPYKTTPFEVRFEAPCIILPPPHDVLIGRDILAKRRLAIDFERGITVLFFIPLSALLRLLRTRSHLRGRFD